MVKEVRISVRRIISTENALVYYTLLSIFIYLNFLVFVVIYVINHIFIVFL